MPLDARIPLDPLLNILTLVLVALVAIMLGRLTWVVVEPSSVLPAADSAPVDVASGSQANGSLRGFREMASLSIFGAPPVNTSAVVNAPDTSLSWVLKGVLADPDPARSGAILAPQGQPEKYYKVGASLPGNVRLDQVLPDRVILAREGKLETLRLQRRDLTAPRTAARRAAPLPQVDPGMTLASDGGEARLDREGWMNDPQRFLDVVSATPVMVDGAMYGIEVSPSRNAREFEAAGLQPGDVVIAVEGTPVSEINDYRDILQELTGDSVTLLLERSGEPMSITITMD